MIEGLYAAASGMMALESRHEVIANNIANSATPGFRRQGAVQEGFNEILWNTMRNPVWFNAERGPGGGLRTIETYTDDSGGALRQTGKGLDVALQGPGYIAVNTPNGERFTRNGQLSVSPEGELMTSSGMTVQGAGGQAIDVSGGAVQITSSGEVLVDGASIGQIRLVEFEDVHGLTREGRDLYVASDAALRGAAAAEATTVVPESLEMSNVQVPYEMVQMMLGLRAYEANQRVINAVDSTLGSLIDQVATPG